jgi:integrase
MPDADQKAKPEKINITRAVIDRIVCPPDKDRVYLFDARTPGLAVCRTRSGATSFYCYRRVQGRPARIRIGGYPELSPEQARKRCSEMNLDIANGRNPQTEKRAAREELTFGATFTRYLDEHAKQRKRTWKADEWMHTKYLAKWDTRQLSTIDAAAVATLHSRLGEKHGKYQANRVLELVQSVFKFAMSVGAAKANPAAGIKAFKEQSRERYLSREEFPKFWAALEAEENETLRDAFKSLLFTGARRGNVLSMRWAELDLRQTIWTIPGEKAKNGRAYSIPLVPAAMEILERRKANAAGEWVFPSDSEAGHVVELKSAWARLLKRAGIADLRIHDLRRTLGSWQAEQGTSLHIIGKSLGHVSQAATAIYARLQVDPVRLSVNQAVSTMLSAITPPAPPAPEQQNDGEGKHVS